MQKEAFVELALSYINCPSIRYIDESMGSNVEGFDCSGFINFLLQQAEYPDTIPRHSNEQFDTLGILIHWEFRDVGDIVFFSRNGTAPTHVGIMISSDEYVHAPGNKNTFVRVDKLEQKIIKPKGVGPPVYFPKDKISQIYFSNPIGFKRITANNGRYRKIFLS